MKKERAAFFCNIAAAVLITAVLVSAAPRISAVGAVGQRVAAVFSPTYFSSKINTEFSTIKSAQTTHTKTTATREAQAMHPISGKDSDPYAHITETPADVAKLMQQEKKVIGSQKQVGKTSEESYQGGGTILSFGSLGVLLLASPFSEESVSGSSGSTVRERSAPPASGGAGVSEDSADVTAVFSSSCILFPPSGSVLRHQICTQRLRDGSPPACADRIAKAAGA